MNIQHKLIDNKGSFFVKENDEQLAELTYIITNNEELVVHHTQVSDKLQGKGIGMQLVGAVVGLAREKKIKLVALCSFTKKIIEKVEAYQDVL